MAKLGRIPSRTRGKNGVREFYLDFRPAGRVWTNHGVRMTHEATARRLLEKIRDQEAEDVSLEEVLARYQAASAPANLVPTWLRRCIDLRRSEMQAGSLSPNFVRELERLTAPGGALLVLRPGVDPPGDLRAARGLEPVARGPQAEPEVAAELPGLHTLVSELTRAAR